MDYLKSGGYICGNGKNTQLIDIVKMLENTDIIDGEKFIVTNGNNTKRKLNLVTSPSGKVFMDKKCLRYLMNKSRQDPSIGPHQWRLILLYEATEQTKSEMEDDEDYNDNKIKYKYTKQELEDYVQEYVLSEYYLETIYWNLVKFVLQKRAKEWEDCAYRQGGGTVCIDATFDNVANIYSSKDCENANDQMIEDHDQRRLMKPIEAALLVGLNKYNYFLFNGLLPNQSEAHVYLIPHLLKALRKMLEKAETPFESFNIATDGLKGNCHLMTKVAWAQKEIHKTWIFNGVNIEEFSKKWKVSIYIYIYMYI